MLNVENDGMKKYACKVLKQDHTTEEWHMVGVIPVECPSKSNWIKLKADLDGTTLTCDCCVQLAQVMTCVRLSAQGFETRFKILQLFSSCMRQSWGSCEVDLHEAIFVVNVTKFHATVVSQSRAV